MPIVFVHGVNVRQDSKYEANVTQRDLRIKELLLPALLPNPYPVRIFNPYWGGYAATLAWGGLSLPSSQVEALDIPQTVNPAQTLVEQILSGNDTDLPAKTDRALLAIAAGSLATAVDLLFALALDHATAGQDADEITELVRLSARVYAYVEQNPKPAWLSTVQDDQAFIVRLRAAVDQWQAAPPPQSLGLTDTWDELKEGLDRFSDVAGDWSSRALLSLTRQPLNTAVSYFLGDIFVYLDERGDQQNPGPIIREITSKLNQAKAAIDPQRDPYLIVLAHSMGGNIVYDLLTYFCPDTYPIDLLITVGSQVALFEELKLYKASQKGIPIDPREQRVAKPASVKHWLNVYDPNDVLSFATAGVFDGVTDYVYTTGKSIIAAHTAYFLRGSFYRRLGARVKELLQP